MRHASTTVLAFVATGMLLLGLSGCRDTGDPEATGSAEPAAATTEPTPDPTTEPTPEPTPTAEPEPTAEDIDGYWCPTPESPDGMGCVTVELPEATYDDGTVVDITAHGGPTELEGGFDFSTEGGPFGTYYPAGVEVAGGVPEYYPGEDLPDQDRIWNGQTGEMLVRPAEPEGSEAEGTDADCESATGIEALTTAGAELPPAPSGEWDLQDTQEWAEESYDACAALSWIVVPLEGCCLAGYPFVVMLFHDGEFVQTATEDIYGRMPGVERISDDELAITWEWVPEGGAAAGPFESATSSFRWDDDQGSVVREGDLPPVSF